MRADESKTKINRKAKLRQLTRRMILLSALAVLSVVATIAAISYSIFRQEQLEHERETSETAIHMFLGGSDTLTNEAFAYADTRDPVHMENYYAEAETTRSRDLAGQVLMGRALGEEEIAAYNRASWLSNDLMNLEAHAMRLIAQSAGLPETRMPEAVAAYALTPEELEMPAEAQYALAHELLFGREYMTKKGDILRSVQDFSFYVNMRFGRLGLRNMQFAWAFMAAGFFIFSLFVLMCVLTIRRIEMERREQLKLEVERTDLRNAYFHIAVGQTRRYLAEYDIGSRRCVVEISSEGAEKLFSNEIDELVETVVQSGYLAEESVSDYRAFFARMERGESPLCDDFQFIDAGGARYWYRFDSTTLFTDGGKPQIAVITYRECGEQRACELAYARFTREREALSMDCIALFECNLSRNVFEGESGGLLPHFDGLSHEAFDLRTRAYAETRVHSEDCVKFELFLNRERLIGAFHDGVFSDSLDYRALQADGEYRWMRYEVQLVPYPDSEDIKLYAVVRDIHDEKCRELALIQRSEQDVMTGTLNRATFVLRMSELLARAPERMHAVLMMDVDSLKRINDTMGHDVGDYALVSFAQKVRAILRPTDLLGRIGGDEFMACLQDVASVEAAVKKAGQICMVTHEVHVCGEELTVSVGIALTPADGTQFAVLYKHADTALYDAKQRKDSFTLYAHDMDAAEA